MHVVHLVGYGVNALASKWWLSSLRQAGLTRKKRSRTRQAVAFFDKLAIGWCRFYLRQLERDQDKSLARQAARIHKLCRGKGTGPLLQKVYARRVYVLDLIGEVISMHKSREDLTVPELQLVSCEFLRRQIFSYLRNPPSPSASAT